jgi:D-xylulose reductase
MMEPLSVGVHSVANLGEFKSDQVCIVFGAGPVGLLCMAVAKALGARRIIAVDIQQDRLDFAKSYAATDIYLPVRLSRNPSSIPPFDDILSCLFYRKCSRNPR